MLRIALAVVHAHSVSSRFFCSKVSKTFEIDSEVVCGSPEAQGTGVFEICSCQDDCVFES